MNTHPKISIVTPTYNQGQYIEETIQSVLSQNYPNLEYIIMDGGSTDNTVDIIKKYKKHFTYWESKPDKGQAHAINKGLKHCTGEIFNWLNSDDYLAPGALHAIANTFKNTKADAVAGQTIYFDKDGFQKPDQLANLEAKKLIRWDNGVVFIQPGLWMKKDLVQQCGGIDEQFHYAFDWDLVIRYLHCAPKVEYINQPLVNFRLHDESKTVSSLDKFHNEEEQILEKIGQLPQFKGLHKTALGRNIRRQWYKRLDEIKSDMQLSKSQKIKTILKESFDWPSEKWNRITLGALKQVLSDG